LTDDHDAVVMKITLAQINPVVGDVHGNVELIRGAMRSAREAGSELLLTPELALLGYPPRDLLSRRGVVEACELALRELARDAVDITLLVGHPRFVDDASETGADGRSSRRPSSRPLRNSLSVLRNGAIAATYDKRLLPSYDVFDEDRHFGPGDAPLVVEVAGERIGLLLCEDIWSATDVEVVRHYPIDCVAESVAAGATMIAVASASPFVVGKRAQHLGRLRELARRHDVTIASVNQVGGKDDLLFDGGSTIVRPDGTIAAMLPSWTADTRSVDAGDGSSVASAVPAMVVAEEADLYEALVMGIRDYFRTCGLRRAVIGLSGGIDSALVATLATAALGPESLCGLLMPSRYSSSHSVDDAFDLVGRLRIGDARVLPIESAHSTLREILGAGGGNESGGGGDWSLDGLPDENLQSRLRGTMVMTVANAIGGAALATGNKSELATGYCTLYGDMIGALAPIGDLVKTRVWALSRWIVANHERCGFAVPPIPESSIEKAPSAELRPDQRDEDTLLPYSILDAIVTALVDHDLDVESTASQTGRPTEEVRRIRRLIDMNEHKRRQAPLVLKVTPRAFGPGRRMPLAMRSE